MLQGTSRPSTAAYVLSSSSHSLIAYQNSSKSGVCEVRFDIYGSKKSSKVLIYKNKFVFDS